MKIIMLNKQFNTIAINNHSTLRFEPRNETYLLNFLIPYSRSGK